VAKYKIEFKKSAVKELDKVLKSDLKRIIRKISSLEYNPRPSDSKKLSNSEKYRIRQGRYRVLYEIVDDILVVYVVKIGHRKDVYR
jgi:mRNA interferase RelE/StbE